jgi:hypothetical protein
MTSGFDINPHPPDDMRVSFYWLAARRAKEKGSLPDPGSRLQATLY